MRTPGPGLLEWQPPGAPGTPGMASSAGAPGSQEARPPAQRSPALGVPMRVLTWHVMGLGQGHPRAGFPPAEEPFATSFLRRCRIHQEAKIRCDKRSPDLYFLL